MLRTVCLVSLSVVLIPSLSIADSPSAIARPAIKIAPKTGQVLAAPAGQQPGIVAMMILSVTPESQSVVVGSPATYTIKANAVGMSSPITLSVKADPARPYTISPNPVSPGGTATLVFQTAMSDAIGTVPFQVIGAAGDRTTTKPATLTLTDPECGNGPVNLTWAVTGLSFLFMTGPQPAPANVTLQLLNSGGRINQTVPRVRVFTVGSNCQYGTCIDGPAKPGTTQKGGFEVNGRGGCARMVWSGEVPALSLIQKQTCVSQPAWKVNILATVDVAGVGAAGGKATQFGCAQGK